MMRGTVHDTAFLSIPELTAAYAAGALSPVDVVRIAYERLDRIEPQINAFCQVAAADESLRLARESEERWRRRKPRGALDGVPITVKDAILAKGWPTLKGSRTSEPHQTTEDAPAVARAREQGAIIFGKTTTPEFGWKAVTDSPLTGITRNPWNTALTPGGSSGGSAAATAAGIGYAGIGTDAGGSVRIPASFCGLSAIKATVGRVPNYPPSAVGVLGHIGPMTRSVSDAALMLDVIGVPDPRDPASLPKPDRRFVEGLAGGVAGKRIAFSSSLGYAKVQPEVAELVKRAAERFTELGANVDHYDPPIGDPTETFRIHLQVGIAHSLRNLQAGQREILDPGLRNLLEQSEKVSLQQYLRACDERVQLARQMRQWHETWDLLLTPTLAVVPFEAGQNAPPDYHGDWLKWTAFTYPFNLTGQPALSLPCGLTKNGLPVGLQIVGDHHQDALVLRAAHAYESAFGLKKHSDL